MSNGISQAKVRFRELKNGHIFCYRWQKKQERTWCKGFLVNKKLARNIEDFYSISEWVIGLIIKLNNKYKIKIIQVSGALLYIYIYKGPITCTFEKYDNSRISQRPLLLYAPLEGWRGIPHIIRINASSIFIKGSAENTTLKAGSVPGKHAHHHKIGHYTHTHYSPVQEEERY